MKQWFLKQTAKEYEEAKSRFEEIYAVDKTSPDFVEVRLLALLINKYEEKHSAVLPLILSK